MVAVPNWLGYVESKIGFILPVAQHRWLEQAVLNTANNHNLDSAELWKEVHKDPKLRQELFDATLILESRFFRHKPSFDFITNLAIDHENQMDETNSKSNEERLNDVNINQKIINKKKQLFKIWSVGCSEGQEVWSIVMSLIQANVHDFKILGTDISTKAIKSAKEAKYSLREKQEIPEKYQCYIENVRLSNPYEKSSWTVSKELHKYASFLLHNIFMSENKQKSTSKKLLLSYDVIVCQNMLIYFRQFDQRDILSRLVKQCKVGGHIVLAPGEAYFWKHPQMEKVANDKINAWKKVR